MNGDDRTSEQVAADDDLRAAIEAHAQVFRAVDSEVDGAVIVLDYVVAYSARAFARDGEDVKVNATVPSPKAGFDSIFGLLRTATLDTEADYYGWKDDEDP